MKASIPTLLRRTAAIIAATGSFCFIGEAAAAPPISFPGGSCTLARIIITPSGGLGIECETATGTTPTITLGVPSSMTVGTVANFTVNRSGDNGAINIGWSGVGTAPGCNGAGGTLSFVASGPNSLGFSITPAGIGSCTVAISGPAGSSAGAVGSPSQVAFTVGSTAPPPPPPEEPSAGCPTGFAPPTDLVTGTIIRSGAEKIFMASGRVYSSPLPRTAPGRMSGEVKLGETPDSAQQLQSIEMSISRCKGEIKTDGGTCYLKSLQGSWNTMVWLETSIPGISDAVARTYNLCFAKPAEGTWYINMRYNYTACWSGTCAYVLQWNDGPL